MVSQFRKINSSFGCLVLIVYLSLSSPLLAQAVESESDAKVEIDDSASLVKDRIKRERAVQDNRSVLLAHRRNYVLPFSYADEPNNDVFDVASANTGESLDHNEIQFQLSIKSPLADGLFTEQGTLYAAFTVKSFWQAYNKEVSAPFRETNYEPEIIWVTPVPWRILGGDATLFALGLSHQSNGRSQLFSRSWNRVYGSVIWERKRFVYHFKAWWRVPESEKDDPLDADGDDNPDIEDFMGNFELTAAYNKNQHEVAVMIRNNLDADDNYGALKIDWTFPLQRRFRGYVQFFNGYGESLIDYDANIKRIGIGILLSDLL